VRGRESRRGCSLSIRPDPRYKVDAIERYVHVSNLSVTQVDLGLAMSVSEQRPEAMDVSRVGAQEEIREASAQRVRCDISGALDPRSGRVSQNGCTFFKRYAVARRTLGLPSVESACEREGT
jgi:hypothetical protein